MNKKLIICSDKKEMDWVYNKFEPAEGTETISYEDYRAEIESIDDLPEVCQRNYMYRGNKVGLKITDYDDMLLPQYGNKFEKTIPRHIFESLRKAAEENLAKDNGYAHPNVIEHWIKIAEGEVPFGYKIKED